MFGLLIGVLFFPTQPQTIILVGIGSALPDLDPEYAFFSREKFRNHQPHRALCHNYLFISLVFVVSPFLALGAFLHTLLDALTTVKDRGVEWLYPFSRLVKRAANDEHGKRLEKIEKGRVYFFQYDPIEITRKSDKDLQEDGPNPWNRTYGPALSGGLLDLGIFLGSMIMFVIWSIWTSFTLGRVEGLNPASYHLTVMLPIAIGSIGIAVNMVAGEWDRRRRADDTSRPTRFYDFTFILSLSLMFLAIFLGAYLNPSSFATYHNFGIPVILGVITATIIGFGLPRIYNKFGLGKLAHHSNTTDSTTKDDVVIV